ncbi:Hypothetical protein, putative, partial [Bodo saltans]
MRGVPLDVLQNEVSDTSELDVLQNEVSDTSEVPSANSDFVIRVQIEVCRAVQQRSNAAPSPISCEKLKWTLPEDLTIDNKLTKVHPHYRRSGGAAAALHRLWTEQNVAASLVNDVISIMGGSSEEHVTNGSPLDLLSWTCGYATKDEINPSAHSPRLPREHEIVFQPDTDYEREDTDESGNGWREWADDEYLCPSIGSQVIFSTICDMPSGERSSAFQQMCENVNAICHDPIKLRSGAPWGASAR